MCDVCTQQKNADCTNVFFIGHSQIWEKSEEARKKATVDGYLNNKKIRNLAIIYSTPRDVSL